ncbi:MAG: hypothetical protein AMXMBFR47_17590 [Planctomycetota bacterium]
MSCPSPSEWDLLAIGAIDAGPAEVLKTHAEACPSCRERFLAARRAHVDRLRRYEVFDRDHDHLRESLLAALPDELPASAARSTRVARRLGDWIMSINTKTTRKWAAVLAPAACVLVAVLVVLWPDNQKSAFATAIERFRSATTIVAHFEAYLSHAEIPMQSGTLSLSDEFGMRFDATANDAAAPAGVPNVMSLSMTHRPGGPVVLVQPTFNMVIRMHTPDGKMTGWSGGLDQSSPDQFLEGFRRLTGEADAQLGRSTIDGRAVEGFEVSARKLGLEYVGRKPAEDVDEPEPSRARIWVDAASHLPVRMEVEVAVDSPMPMGRMHVRAVYSNFEFDRPLDAALFESKIPEGARVVDVNVPAPNEETLLTSLRIFAEKAGRYPLALDPSRVSAELMVVLAREGGFKIDSNDPASVMNAELMETVMTVTMGCAYVQQLARDGLEPEYFGDIVTPEETTEALLRWRLPSGEIRVIYGDLRAETLAREP